MSLLSCVCDFGCNNNKIPIRTLTYATVGAGVVVTVSYLIRRYFNRYLYWNSEIIKAGKIESLYVYPIKSCKGIEVEHLDCTVRGSRYGNNNDRYFLVVDAKAENLFLTARAHPSMVLIEPKVEGLTLTISTPNKKSILVDLEEVLMNKIVRLAKLHGGAKTGGYDCGDEVGHFLTEFLQMEGKKDLRLLYFSDDLYTERDLSSLQSYWNNPVPQVQDKIGYADLAAYLAFTTASINDLNSRLEKFDTQIDCRNFRPNIVVSGIKRPYDEDYWLDVKIGKVEFTCYKPCTRCIITTINPDFGVKHDQMQPLRELRNYRLSPKGKLLDLYEKSPVFGVNMALKKAGRIHVGDEVFIRYKSTPF